MNIIEAIHLAFDTNNIKLATNTKGITKDVLIEFIASGKPLYGGAFGYTSAEGVNKFLRKTFPDKFVSKKYKHCSYITYLLDTIAHKYCSKCKTVQPYTNFHLNTSTVTGYADYCAVCQCAVRADYYQENREKEISANAIRDNRLKECQIPVWANLVEIRKFYANCPTGFHVDHILPLNGKLVSGLHTLNNLQYLPAKDNLSKGNRYTV